jgi:hypothetical protein
VLAKKKVTLDENMESMEEMMMTLDLWGMKTMNL